MNHLTRTAVTVASAVLALTGLAACSSTPSSPSTASSSKPSMSSMDSPSTADSPSVPGTSGGSGATASSAMIMIKDYKFTDTTNVAPGATVTIMNTDSEAHTVTSDTGKTFDVKIDPGKSATLTAPSKPGAYAYHCTFHASMHGSLTVS